MSTIMAFSEECLVVEYGPSEGYENREWLKNNSQCTEELQKVRIHTDKEFLLNLI